MCIAWLPWSEKLNELFVLFTFQHGERYTSSADMWALGACLSFIAKHKHKFNSEYEVRKWDGSYHVLNQRLYSNELVELTDELLSPDPDNRPSAQDCFDESKLHWWKNECLKNHFNLCGLHISYIFVKSKMGWTTAPCVKRKKETENRKKIWQWLIWYHYICAPLNNLPHCIYMYS